MLSGRRDKRMPLRRDKRTACLLTNQLLARQLWRARPGGLWQVRAAVREQGLPLPHGRPGSAGAGSAGRA
jgi:hypothetical protein